MTFFITIHRYIIIILSISHRSSTNTLYTMQMCYCYFDFKQYVFFIEFVDPNDTGQLLLSRTYKNSNIIPQTDEHPYTD